MATENMIKFLRGNVASLPQTATAGAVYFTKDEGLYLGLADGSYHRYGDFIEVANVDSLPAEGAHVKAMYYCTAENILAKWNGTKWVQINKQQTLAELGGVAKSVYEAKIAALEKADTDNANVIAGVDTRLQAAEKKLESVATTEGLGELAATVAGHTTDINTIKGDVNTIKGDVNTEGSMLKIAKAAADAKDAAIQAAQATADQAQREVDALETVVADYKTANDARVKALEDVDNATQAEMDAAVKVLEDADAAILAKIGDVAEDETVVGLIEAAQAKADAAYVKPAAGIGTDDLHADVVAALGKANSALQAADIENKADKATTLAGYGITDAYTKNEVDAAVGAKVAQSDYDTKMGELDAEDERIAGLVSDEAAARKDADDALDARLVKVEAFFEGAAEDGEGLQNALDTLVEIQEYVDTHGEAAKTMVDNIAANAKAIEDEAKRADEAEKALGGRIDDLSDVVNTKASQDDLNALDGRVEAAEGKITTLEGEMDAVEGRADTLEGKVADLEAASATHATRDELQAVSDVADAAVTVEEMNAAISAAGHASQADLTAHVDDAVKHITADERTAWNKAITDLADHKTAYDAKVAALEGADTAIRGEFAAADTALKTELQGYVDQAELDAVAAAKTETDTQVGALKTEMQGKIDTVSGALNTYKIDNDAAVALKADASAVYTKAEVEAMLTWGEF